VPHDFVKIEFDGEEIETVYSDLVRLEIDLDDELASMFRLRLSMIQTAEGWTSLDDEALRIWKPVAITAGFGDDLQELFTGFITHVKPNFSTSTEAAYLDVWGMDSSVLLDRAEILKDWPNKTDSAIAREIIESYGLEADIEDTTVEYDEDVSTTIQRETDMQFLKRLALRNGYECYVHGNIGYFKLPTVDPDPQPVLAVHFGAETNVHNFSLQVDALMPVNVGMFQIDRLNKETLEVDVQTSLDEPLGELDASAFLAPDMQPGQIYVGRNGASEQTEMQALCQGLMNQSQWFVTARGEVDANQYQQVLLPRQSITVKGIGETYSGIYAISHVTHVFTAAGYTQQLKLKRNALLPTGDEEFGGESSLLGGL